MPTALVMTSGGSAAPALAADMAEAGFEVAGETNCSVLLQDVIKKATDTIVCFQETPDDIFFAACAAVAASAPCPVVVFTMDPDAGKMATATSSGVHAYVVNGYSSSRLRSVVQLAQARFAYEQSMRQELEGLRRRFDERKLVDRAKGILMGARRLREEDAFRTLRSAAMDSKQRIGQISQTVIDSAHYAEAVNRAGRLRMLSQRIVKLYALACAGDGDPTHRKMLAESVMQIDRDLADLDRSLSTATFGDLLASVLQPWAKLQDALKAPPTISHLPDVDIFAEDLLRSAERLTANLEVASFALALHAVNVAGRQRMLIQRLAKEVLLDGLLSSATRPADEPGKVGTLDELLSGLNYLDRLPLTNAEIEGELKATRRAFADFQHGPADPTTVAGRSYIAVSSETLLGHFDRITDLIERGIHALIGL